MIGFVIGFVIGLSALLIGSDTDLRASVTGLTLLGTAFPMGLEGLVTGDLLGAITGLRASVKVLVIGDTTFATGLVIGFITGGSTLGILVTGLAVGLFSYVVGLPDGVDEGDNTEFIAGATASESGLVMGLVIGLVIEVTGLNTLVIGLLVNGSNYLGALF